MAHVPVWQLRGPSVPLCFHLSWQDWTTTVCMRHTAAALRAGMFTLMYGWSSIAASLPVWGVLDSALPLLKAVL